MSSLFHNPDKMELTVKLNAIAAQEGNDGEQYDLMVEAADRIRELEADRDKWQAQAIENEQVCVGWVREKQQRISELEAERDAANAVAKSYVEQVDELEAFIKAHTSADEGAYADLKRKHTALLEKLEGLYNGCVQYQEKRYPGDFDSTVYLKMKRDDFRAIIEQEKGDE